VAVMRRHGCKPVQKENSMTRVFERIERSANTLKDIKKMVDDQNAIWHSNEDKADRINDALWARIGELFETLNQTDKDEFNEWCDHH